MRPYVLVYRRERKYTDSHSNVTVEGTPLMANLSRTQSEASGSLASDASNPIPPEALQEMEDEAILQLIHQTE